MSWSDDAGTHELVVQRRTLLGSAGPVDVVIRDRTVSRVHAELEPSEGALWIRDLGSRNGTFVGGASVTQTCIRNAEDVRVGATVLHVDYARGADLPVELWSRSEFHGLVGTSETMRELFALLSRAAPTEASILIRGETGTGKEVVARAIHSASLRATGPYVVVDCAALPENLLDAELFGHTKGAFTGAATARAGAIETADGGTVFLDEIGELPISMQPKLLRVLEQRTVRRIGESTHRPMNVRFITATHRDLLSMVARGEFREDLYFRLCVLPVTVPPLRNRREDIPPLVEHFLRGKSLSADLMEDLTRMPWRGNVRELRNVVERALALGEDGVRQGQVSSTFSAKESPSVTSSSRRTLPPPSSLTGIVGVPSTRDAGLPRLFEPDEDRDSTSTLRAVQDPPPFPASYPNSFNLPLDLAVVGVPSDTLHGYSSRGASPAAPFVDPRSVQAVRFEGDFRTFRDRWLEEGEREYLRQMLERHKRNIPALAAEAGVNKTYIYRIMRKHGL